MRSVASHPVEEPVSRGFEALGFYEGGLLRRVAPLIASASSACRVRQIMGRSTARPQREDRHAEIFPWSANNCSPVPGAVRRVMDPRC